ncbi:MAG: hypothetical protein K2X11_14840 [Acetobacteraceae bacterium]|nr:hypothetical protein [Acetobacteraceae bacterium]
MTGALPRRALLGALAAGPAAAQGQPRLRILIAAEGLRDLAPLLPAPPGWVLEVTEEHPSFVGGPLAESVRRRAPLADLVIVGLPGMELGRRRNVWDALPPALAAAAPSADPAALSPGLRHIRDLVEREALALTAAPGGPGLLHLPRDRVRPPRTPRELLDFARQDPRGFLYPRLDSSASGLHFAVSLPYLLNDRDPADPQTGWDRSWAYLEALDPHIAYYPVSTLAAMEELKEGGCALITGTILGHITGRVRGRLPADTQLALFDGAPVLPLGVVALVPRFITAEAAAGVAALAPLLFEPRLQGLGFGRGILPGEPPWPGTPAVALPPDEQAALDALLPTTVAAEIAARPVARPLAHEFHAHLLLRWDQQIAGRR